MTVRVARVTPLRNAPPLELYFFSSPEPAT